MGIPIFPQRKNKEHLWKSVGCSQRQVIYRKLILPPIDLERTSFLPQTPFSGGQEETFGNCIQETKRSEETQPPNSVGVLHGFPEAKGRLRLELDFSPAIEEMGGPMRPFAASVAPGPGAGGNGREDWGLRLCLFSVSLLSS